MSENCNLAYFALQRRTYSTTIITNRIKSTCASAKTAIVHQGMYFQKLKFYSFANNFRSTPNIFALSFVNNYVERFLLIFLLVAMVTPTKMAMFIYLLNII